MIKKTCVICKKKFQTNYPHKITCSDDCGKENRRRYHHNWYSNNVELPIRICVICQKEYKYTNSGHTRGRRGKTCSYECGKKNMIKNNKDYYLKNKESFRVWDTNWRKNNPTKFNLMRQRYRKKYPEKVAIYARRSHLKTIEIRRFTSRLDYERQKLAVEILRTIDPTITVRTIGSIGLLRELGIDVAQIMENIDVD